LKLSEYPLKRDFGTALPPPESNGLQKSRQLIKGNSIMDYSRLRICLYLLAAILCIGTFGYAYFESMPIFDAEMKKKAIICFR